MKMILRALAAITISTFLFSCVQEPNPGTTDPNSGTVQIDFLSGKFTNKRNEQLKLSYKNFSPLQMKLSENGECIGGEWIEFKTNIDVELAVPDGVKTYSIELKNNAGEVTNCSSTKITLDQTIPEGSALNDAGDEPLSSFRASFTLSAQDNVQVSKMSVTESTDCNSPIWEDFNTHKSLSLSNKGGVKKVAVIFNDIAGNLSECIILSLVVQDDLSPDVPSGWLHTSGKDIKDSLDNKVILRGVNVADPQHLDTKPWERPGVTAMSVVQNVINNFNVNVIRIPVLPGSGGKEGWFSSSTGKQKYFDNHLKDLVQYITDQKIYAIIDFHYISDYSSLKSKTLEFWEFMAPQFADNPYVIYEIFNEPINPDSWSTWKTTIAQPAVDVIRKYAPENLIIVGGPGWSSHMAGAATDPVKGSNIVYTAHVYSNQGPEKWEARFGELTKKYPVFVTEWGFEEGGTEGGTASDYGTPFLKWIEDRGLSWTAWCFDSVWGPRMFDSDWKLKKGNGGMGEFVKNALLKNP